MDRAAIFDMDGLLIDSEPLWKVAERRIFASVGVQISPEMSEVTMGLRTDEVTAYWYEQQPWSGPSLEDVENSVIETVAALIEEQGEPKDGVRYILDFFADRGYRLGLASNSPDLLIDVVVQKLGIRRYFRALCSSVHEKHGKPSPAVYLTAARRLDVAASRCLVFEDSVPGLLAAKAAGMTAIAVPPSADFSDERFDIADLKLRSLSAFTEAHAAALASR